MSGSLSIKDKEKEKEKGERKKDKLINLDKSACAPAL
jgi:hypothetical protein